MRWKQQTHRTQGARRNFVPLFSMICWVGLMTPSVSGQQGASLAVQGASLAVQGGDPGAVMDDDNLSWRQIARSGEHLLFAGRVCNYTQCLLDWAVQTASLSGHQRGMLMMALDTQKDQLVRQRQRYDSGPYASFLPIQFAVVAAEIDGAFGRLLTETEILSQEQRRQLQAALRDRDAQRRRDHLQGVVSRIDRELFLTAAQQTCVLDEAGRYLNLDNGAFDFPFDASWRHARWSPVEQRLTPLLTKSELAETWSQSQQGAVDMLIDAKPRRLLRQTLEDPSVTLRNVVSVRMAPGRTRCLRVAQMQLDLYRREGLIDRGLAERLEFQARSHVEQYMKRWRISTLSRLQLSAGGGAENVWYSDLLPMLTGVTASAAWQTHLQLEVPGLVPFEQQRTAVSRKRLAQYMTGLLDREFWLTSRQRDILRQHLEIAMPDHWLTPTSGELLYGDWSLTTIAAAVDLLSKTEFEEFHDNQRRAFWGVKRLVSPGDNALIEAPSVSGTDVLIITNGYSRSGLWD